MASPQDLLSRFNGEVRQFREAYQQLDATMREFDLLIADGYPLTAHLEDETDPGYIEEGLVTQQKQGDAFYAVRELRKVMIDGTVSDTNRYLLFLSQVSS